MRVGLTRFITLEWWRLLELVRHANYRLASSFCTRFACHQGQAHRCQRTDCRSSNYGRRADIQPLVNGWSGSHHFPWLVKPLTYPWYMILIRRACMVRVKVYIEDPRKMLSAPWKCYSLDPEQEHQHRMCSNESIVNILNELSYDYVSRFDDLPWETWPANMILSWSNWLGVHPWKVKGTGRW